MKAYILDNDFIESKNKIKIGGLETYIRCLYGILQELQYQPVVYQYSTTGFDLVVEGIHVVGVKGAKNCSDLLKRIDVAKPDYNKDLLIFATDPLIVNNSFKKAIAIQHGIPFDVTKQKKTGFFENYLTIMKGALRAIKKRKRFMYCSNIVCVDYNFVNWYRTQVASVDANMYVIPNFTRIPSIVERENKTISIVFARRLVNYRGTRLFTEAIIQVLKEHPSISVVIAGVGPEEQWMKKKLKKYKQVSFTAYSPDDSIQFHQQFDIAVVPTIGSEGTSLSLLEAMSAGCAVIATNVGGMTNIILDEYNGLMISPTVEELRNAIERLINDNELRRFLSEKGRETVAQSFSYDKWKKSWIKVIENLDDRN